MKVLKRDGTTVDFNIDKIINAVQKCVNVTGIGIPTTGKDIAWLVKQKLGQQDVVGVEEIQDVVENTLKERGFKSVSDAYHKYRIERTKVREKNSSISKTIEKISGQDSKVNDTKRDNANIDGDSAMGTMLQIGSETSKWWYLNNMIPEYISNAHRNGDIHIHDLDFYRLTMTCCQIDLKKLFKNGFNTGHGFLREPNSIGTACALAAIAIQADQNDQHGGQSIPEFDYYMAPYVKKSYKKNVKLVEDINDTLLEWEVEEKAWDLTRKQTFQAMEAFIANLNSMHSRAGAQVPFSSINYGTDTSKEGRLVIEQLLLATDAGLGNGETPIFPVQIFKCKKGVNLNDGDPNYDLFKLACKVSAKRLFPNFSFLDAPFNLKYYKEGDPDTEVAMMGCRTRTIANIHDPSREVAPGRGNLSFTTINLPRLAIESNGNVTIFMDKLDKMLELSANQLIERLKIQCKRKPKNFPFLMGQGVWIDSEKLGPDDDVTEILKHGSLSIGFIGLAETLISLTGKHHGESNESQELGIQIIKKMREFCDKKCQETKLNFALIATPAEGLSGRFVKIDKQKYGIIPGVTDKDYYTNSFHVPVYYKINAYNKISIEAPYHNLTNGGHITYIEMDGDASLNVQAFEKIVHCMADSGIGYGAINHPVDTCLDCGWKGAFSGDECPKCKSKRIERLRRITGYLVGTLDRWNDAKKSEEHDRVKHGI